MGCNIHDPEFNYRRLVATKRSAATGSNGHPAAGQPENLNGSKLA
jgi:hypothetical protein